MLAHSPLRPPQIKIAALGERGDFAVSHRALERPEAAVRMDKADATRSDNLFGTFQRTGDFLQRFHAIAFYSPAIRCVEWRATAAAAGVSLFPRNWVAQTSSAAVLIFSNSSQRA